MFKGELDIFSGQRLLVVEGNPGPEVKNISCAVRGLPTLGNGILLGATREGAQISGRSVLVKDLRTWMQFPQLVEVNSGTDGTDTWVSFSLDFSDTGGVPLRSKFREGLTYRIQDDLSGLLDLKVWVAGYTFGD